MDSGLSCVVDDLTSLNPSSNNFMQPLPARVVIQVEDLTGRSRLLEIHQEEAIHCAQKSLIEELESLYLDSP
jgi:hypothetical protein